MEFQLILVLILAFVILGPERMMDLAFKLGEAVRKAREVWDEVRMQAYVENINKSIMESEQKEASRDEEEDEISEEDLVPDELNEELSDEDFDFEEEETLQEEETLEDERESTSTSGDAADGAPERAPKQAD